MDSLIALVKAHPVLTALGLFVLYKTGQNASVRGNVNVAGVGLGGTLSVGGKPIAGPGMGLTNITVNTLGQPMPIQQGGAYLSSNGGPPGPTGIMAYNMM